MEAVGQGRHLISASAAPSRMSSPDLRSTTWPIRSRMVPPGRDCRESPLRVSERPFQLCNSRLEDSSSIRGSPCQASEDGHAERETINNSISAGGGSSVRGLQDLRAAALPSGTKALRLRYVSRGQRLFSRGTSRSAELFAVLHRIRRHVLSRWRLGSRA